MKIITGKQRKPRKVLLYGSHGVGKSTLAAQAPHPLFLDIESGLNDIDCAKTERLQSILDVQGAVAWLIANETPYQSLVIDTLDWLERLIWDFVASSESKKSIEEIPYGKGYKLAVKQWDYLLKGFSHLIETRGMHIVMLAHAKIQKFSSPDTDSYDRYEPGLHDLASSLIQEWSDEVLFCTTRVLTRKEDAGFGQKRTIAIGGKERIIKTSESASIIAKHRCQLPDELSFDEFWPTYLAAVAQPATNNISGIVVDGHSKKKDKELVTNG